MGSPSPVQATTPVVQASPGAAAAPSRVVLRRAPLAPAAMAVVAGVVAGRYLNMPTGIWLALAVAGLAVAVVALLRPHLHLAGCVGAIAATAGLSAAYVRWSCFTIPADHVVTYTAGGPIMANVRGRIVTWPQIVKDDPSLHLPYRRADRTCFLLQSEQIQTSAGPASATGLVRVTVDEPCTDIQVGQSVTLLCRLGRYQSARNPGQIDPSQIARENHVLAWATVPAAQGVVVHGGPTSWHRQWYWRLRAMTRQHLATAGPEQESQLVNALILGERHPALQKLNQLMVRAGVAHYLSISGSHLAIFLGFVYLVCRLLSLSPRRASIAVLVILGAYLLLAEASAPLLRSGIMAGSLATAGLAKRRHSGLNALAASTIILLAVDPLDLFSAGFQLSFGLVLGMLLLSRPIKNLLFGRYIRRRGLMVFRDQQRWRRFVNFRLSNWLMDAVGIGLAAYVVSAPLVAYHFGVFSPYASVLSLLLVVPMTLVLVPGYVSMALLWPMPGLSYTMGQLACQAADGLEACVGWMQGLPGLCTDLYPVSPGWTLLCFLGAALVLWTWRSTLGKVAAAAVLIAAGGWLYVSQRPATAPPAARLHVLSVGAGQCIVLHSPSGKTYIFDAGTRSGFDCYRTVLAPFLRQQRLPAPSAIFVSHANADHFNGLYELIARKPPGRFFCCPQFSEEDTRGPADDTGNGAADLQEMLTASGVPKQRLSAGQGVTLDEHVAVRVLWPPATFEKKPNTNDTSLVLKVTCDGSSILLPGDIEAAAQEALRKSGADLKADVLVLPHHGSWNSLLPDFVAKVAPKFTIISSSYDPCPLKPEAKAAALYHSPGDKTILGTWKQGYICMGLGYGRVTVLSP